MLEIGCRKNVKGKVRRRVQCRHRLFNPITEACRDPARRVLDLGIGAQTSAGIIRLRVLKTPRNRSHGPLL